MRLQHLPLVFVPITIIMAVLHVNNPTLMFIFSCLAILPLAGVMGHATEELAKYRGQAVGGFLNATFGNATELIIAIVAVLNGQVEVVRASLIGSIIGNLLLVLGLSLLCGGLKYNVQVFNKDIARTHGSMMTISIISFVIPAIFVASLGTLKDTKPLLYGSYVQSVSLYVAALLIAIYIGSLVFSLWTHQTLFRDGEEEEQEKPHMKQSTAILILVASTVLIALESEFLVHSLEPTVEKFHLNKLFVGLIILPIIGNAAEHSTAIFVAMKNKMDISLNIAVSSATQIAMFVAPLIILLSYTTRHHVDIVFTTVELAAVVAGVLIANEVTRDGKSNWLEGALLLAAYIIIGIGFFFMPELMPVLEGAKH